MKNQSKPESSCIKKPVEEFLSKEDFEYYKNLKETLSSHICRNCRNKRVQSFNQMLITIHYFVNRKKEDDWKRSLICGVCWHKIYICVNIRQMSYLLEKCKSSINGSLKRLFLVVLQNKQQSKKILLEAIPYLKSHQEMLHMWSVRQRAQPLQMFVPFTTDNRMSITNSYQTQFFFRPDIQNEKSNQQTNIISNPKINDIKIEERKEKNEFISKSEKNDNNNNPKVDDFFNFYEDFNLLEDEFN